MVFKKSFKLLVATGTTPFSAVVSIISEEDCVFIGMSSEERKRVTMKCLVCAHLIYHIVINLEVEGQSLTAVLVADYMHYGFIHMFLCCNVCCIVCCRFQGLA